jgi:hypothetical protein
MKYTEGQVSIEQMFPILSGEWDRKQPELKLWAVCLSQAIAGAVGLIRCNDLKYWYRDDRYWLFRDKRNCPGSCQWICDVLEIDRKELLTFVWKNRHVLRKSPYRLRSLN